MLKPLKTLSPRRKKQGAGVLTVFTLYTVLGFLAAPHLVQKLARDYVHETLGLDLKLGDVQFNPWQLALRLDDVSVREPQGEVLVSIRSLYLNLDAVASLWQRRIEVDDFDILQPRLHARIDAAGKLNLMQLVPPEDPDDKSETPWQLGVLDIRQGRVDFQDDSRPVPFATTLEPLTLRLVNLSSHRNGQGKYVFAAETGKGERLAWEGAVNLNPVRSSGKLSLSHWQAATLAEYAQDLLPVSVNAGFLDFSGEYALSLETETPRVSVTDGVLSVTGLKTATRTANPLQLAMGRVGMQQVAFQWPEQNVTVPAFQMENVELGDGAGPMAAFRLLRMEGMAWKPGADQARLGKAELTAMQWHDGADVILDLPEMSVKGLTLYPGQQRLETGGLSFGQGKTRVIRLSATDSNWQQYLARLNRRLMPAPAAEPLPSKPWQLTLGELGLSDFSVIMEDRSPKKKVELPLYIRRLVIHPELDLKKPHRFEGEVDIGKASRLAMSGSLDEQPFRLDSRVQLTGFELPPMAPYLADLARFQLVSGRVEMDGRLRLRKEKELSADYQGQVGVVDFAANDLFLQERFLAWKRLQLKGMDVSLTPMKFRVREVAADSPFTRLVILPDKTINFSQILRSDSSAVGVKAAPSKTGPDSGAFEIPVEVQRMVVSNGSMLFADFSLKPQFATGIESLSGDIRKISTRPGSVADIALKGRVDQYGKADIRGQINPLAPDANTDMKLRFENLELTTLTPYSAKFAGYRIDKGKLSLDLGYRIENRKLQAANKVVLHQLTLGEKVESPDAVNLPLRLALALLKDSNGVIDLDLPISGSLDDPQFKVGPIVWQAFVNVITKVATAPFRFIAGLVGGGDDMDSLAFAPGSAEVSGPTRDKLLKLAEALQKRPELKSELRGTFDPALDRSVLQVRRLDEAVQARKAAAGTEIKALESLYLEKFSPEALKQIKALAVPPAGTVGQPQPESALRTALRTALLEKEEVADGDLRELALDRSRALRQVLIEQGQVTDSRVFVLEPEAVTGAVEAVASRVVLNVI